MNGHDVAYAFAKAADWLRDWTPAPVYYAAEFVFMGLLALLLGAAWLLLPGRYSRALRDYLSTVPTTTKRSL